MDKSGPVGMRSARSAPQAASRMPPCFVVQHHRGFLKIGSLHRMVQRDSSSFVPAAPPDPPDGARTVPQPQMDAASERRQQRRARDRPVRHGQDRGHHAAAISRW